MRIRSMETVKKALPTLSLAVILLVAGLRDKTNSVVKAATAPSDAFTLALTSQNLEAGTATLTATIRGAVLAGCGGTTIHLFTIKPDGTTEEQSQDLGAISAIDDTTAVFEVTTDQTGNYTSYADQSGTVCTVGADPLIAVSQNEVYYFGQTAIPIVRR